MDSEVMSVIIQIISLVNSMELDSQPKPESNLMSLVNQAISVFNSMDWDFESQPEPLLELISLIDENTSLLKSTLDLDLEPESKLRSLITKLISLKDSMDLDSDTKLKSVFMRFLGQTLNLDPEPELITLIRQILLLVKSVNLDLEQEVISLSTQLISMDSESESQLFSLIVRLISREGPSDSGSELVSRIIQIISLVNSMVLDSKPKSQFMSLVTETVSLFESVDLDSQPKPLSELISLMSQDISCKDSSDQDSKIMSLIGETLSLKPEPEFISHIYQILSLVNSINSKFENLVFLCPQVKVRFEQGKFHVEEEEQVSWSSNNNSNCFAFSWDKFRLRKGGDASGENLKEEYSKAPDEINHTLHPKHSLQLVLSQHSNGKTECYCHTKTQPGLLIDHPEWHEHTLALFPRETSLTCNLCALNDSGGSPIYMCPPCDFVVHLRCITLPHVLRISRHHHRISFTPSFDQGYWSCGVCRGMVDNKYGGYSCNKAGCSYAAHARCATQRNVWDGIDLEGVPEEIEEELKPFETISDGIIQHFIHQHHHLRLNENTNSEDKSCQACVTAIYCGNFYSCMQCDYILHETCANLSRTMYHPIHPHQLTLVGGYDGLANAKDSCSACPWLHTTGFFYECRKERCYFKVHVQCATISEPLINPSHMHPLFLTSKPGERRMCTFCRVSRRSLTNETFNCLEEWCDFALCFKCATLPQKVRYKHDEHILTLSYGEVSTGKYWCEDCEREINPMGMFYTCDEPGSICCVTLHIECLIGHDLYMKPRTSWLYKGKQVDVLSSTYMSRPICYSCETRCPFKIVLQCCKSLFCTTDCLSFEFVFLINGLVKDSWSNI